MHLSGYLPDYIDPPLLELDISENYWYADVAGLPSTIETCKLANKNKDLDYCWDSSTDLPDNACSEEAMKIACPTACTGTCVDGIGCDSSNGEIVCESCPEGLIGDGLVDGDGCYDTCEWYSGFGGCDQVYGSCFVIEDCRNQECGCQAGFSLQYEDNSCLDVFEVDNGGCDDASRATCTNRYTDNNDVTCKCNPGYKGTGIGWDRCRDICQVKNGDCAAASSTCLNLFNGKVDCVCKSGFTKNAAGKCVKGAGSFATATFKNTIIGNPWITLYVLFGSCISQGQGKGVYGQVCWGSKLVSRFKIPFGPWQIQVVFGKHRDRFDHQHLLCSQATTMGLLDFQASIKAQVCWN